MNLGGGTHHAGRDFARGYCLFNDVAVALAELRREGLVDRAVVVDCDVHQGDGTAHIFAAGHDARSRSRSTARATIRSSACPPTSTSTFRPAPATPPTSTRARGGARCRAARRGRADIAFYLAGADPWEGDRLGRLALTKAGLRAPRRARPRPPARDGRRGLRRARRRLRGGRRATPSTSTRRRPRPSPPACVRLRPSRRSRALYPLPARGGVVLMGTRGLCTAELGVRFPSPPSEQWRLQVDADVLTREGSGAGAPRGVDHDRTLATAGVTAAFGERRATRTMAALTPMIARRPIHCSASPMPSPQYGFEGPTATGMR